MSHALLRDCVLGGAVVAATKFTPLPFVDDFLETQSKKFIIKRTLRKNGTSMEPELLSALYDDSGRYLKRISKRIVRAPLDLVLFPFRRIVRLATSVRTVPLSLMYGVLLGRTFDRCLKSGVFNNLSDKQKAEAAELARKAFDGAFGNIDVQVISKIAPQAMDQLSVWTRESKDSIKKFVGFGDDKAAAILERSKQIENISESFEQPEVVTLMEHFDQKFDTLFNVLLAEKQFT